jgi:uncharacterized protein
MHRARLQKTILVVLFLVTCLSVIPVKAQYVSDFWVDEIENYLLQVDVDTTAEIVVFIVPSLVGHGLSDENGEINEIVKLGVYIFNELPLETFDGEQVGIGKKGRDNGVLVLIAVEERQWRIEVGYGLEGYITDIESYQIAEQYLAPKLGEAEFSEAVYDTVVALSEKIPYTEEQLEIRGRYYYENTSAPVNGGIPDWVIILLIIIMILVFGGAVTGSLGGILGRSTRRREGGRSGGGGSGGRW